jgi:hypothetical protein
MSKHKEKLKKLFEHPLSGNIESAKLIHALEHYGATVDISKHGRALIHFKGKEHSLVISHGNELTKDSIVKLRHFLEEVDLTPDKL